VNESVLIGIDHGYAAMKTAHCSFPTGLERFDHKPFSEDHLLEYDGNSYLVGNHRQPLQKDKTADDNCFLMTLAAIALELEYRKAPATASVILAAGLPLTNFGRERKSFFTYLCRGDHPISFRWAGRPYSITILNAVLFPQGYAAALTQPDLLREPSVILADIGGWTVDLMRLDNRLPDVSTCRSLELGVIRCVEQTQEQVRRKLGLSVTPAQIESVLRGNPSGMDEGAKQVIQAEADQYVRSLHSYHFPSNNTHTDMIVGERSPD
jgi:plasmid segregation protein ParM